MSPGRRPAETKLIKLTDDTGLTAGPAISADGKLLPYASDRGSSDDLSIWIQQLGPGDTAVQLSHHHAHAGEPAFSPDGTTVAFHSRQDGGGIYLIPVIGGEPRRLTPVWP
jgi:Tol biopolymer transport system component